MKQKIETVYDLNLSSVTRSVQRLVDEYNSNGYVLTAITGNDDLHKILLVFTKEE